MHNIDYQRKERNGFHEVIFSSHKSLSQLSAIVKELIERKKNIFATRLSEEKGAELVKQFQCVTYDPLSQTLTYFYEKPALHNGSLAILAAGTADTIVAEEAYRTAHFYGVEATRFYDVGVAGLHRLLNSVEKIKKFDVIICVAGMEGALPSVVGGLMDQPIIAVPTSVGYGVHLQGLSTLAAMLNSCSEGITVVNIDNGFGAACAAMRILRNTASRK